MCGLIRSVTHGPARSGLIRSVTHGPARSGLIRSVVHGPARIGLIRSVVHGLTETQHSLVVTSHHRPSTHQVPRQL
jgi:hypothetical protein